MTKEELKQWRETNNLTQQQLADLLNVSQVTVARWETDARKIPSFLYLALIGLEKSKRKGGEKGYGLRKKKKR
ncbi:MAG: helix-turn-helix transcriptional regulator [Pseudomonadota bacterium]